jgi:hypothetical protein
MCKYSQFFSILSSSRIIFSKSSEKIVYSQVHHNRQKGLPAATAFAPICPTAWDFFLALPNFKKSTPFENSERSKFLAVAALCFASMRN